MRRHRAARFHRGAALARRVSLSCTGVLGLTLLGCGSAVPGPKLGPHYKEEPVIVPYPPPPARAEVVPSPPPEMRHPVWIDGEWQWKASRWIWQPGRWELPVPRGYYAPPTTLRVADGTLYFYQGTWKEPRQQR